MEVEERPYAPPPHKRLGGPLRSFASGDLFTMILGAGCTAVICSVRPAPCPCRCLRYLLVVLPPVSVWAVAATCSAALAVQTNPFLLLLCSAGGDGRSLALCICTRDLCAVRSASGLRSCWVR